MSDIPQRDGVTWFGDPLADGTVFTIQGESGLSAMYFELCMAVARKNGYSITPELVSEFRHLALEREADERARLRARGIASNIRKLLSATRKGDANRWAKSMVLDARDFSDLIQNSGAVGLSHHARFQEFLPEDRKLAADEDEVLFSGSRDVSAPSSLVQKVRQIFTERENRAVHLFADSGEQWHLFIMTHRDMVGDPWTGKPHWKCGPHVHYLSHVLESRLTKVAAWKALDDRKHTLPCVHIRLRHPDSSPDDGRRLMLDEATRRAAVVSTRSSAKGSVNE